MAEFVQSTTSNLTPKIVVGVIAEEAAKKSYMEKFIGEGTDSIIQLVPALKKEAGDQVACGLGLKVTGDGITGDDDLEGNEDSMSYKNQLVKIDQRRKAIKLKGKMTEKRTKAKLRKDAVTKLSTWKAEVKDEEMFYHLSCSRGVRVGTLSTSYAGGPNAFVTPDADHLKFAGGKTLATIATTDTLKATDIDALVEYARLTDPMIQPINVDGGEYWVLVISPEQATDLRADTTWLAAQRDANVRGNGNPIFSGAMGVYNGVVVHISRNIVKFTAYGTNSISACRALFLGAQAGLYCPAEDGSDYVEKKFDYENKVGFAVGFIHGIAGAAYSDEAGANTALFGRILLDTAI